MVKTRIDYLSKGKFFKFLNGDVLYQVIEKTKTGIGYNMVKSRWDRDNFEHYEYWTRNRTIVYHVNDKEVESYEDYDDMLDDYLDSWN